jgi:hypothetical protein
MAYWTCARSETNREGLVVRHLQLGGCTVCLPRLRVWRRSHGRIETRPPLFPNYCFVLIELQWHGARWCPGLAALITARDGTSARVPGCGAERNPRARG